MGQYATAFVVQEHRQLGLGLTMKGMKVTRTNKYLKCVKEIEACPELSVGDLLWGQEHREIWPGGYEYVVCVRREDGRIIKFRVDHLEDCFEVVEVEDENWV